MNRILHNEQNSQRILQMVADTLILVRPDGMCVDINSHSELWFLQEELLLGKNLFDFMPKRTLEKILPIFREVVEKQEKANRNFRLDLKDQTYYFKCIMTPYDGMVLCQYRDITARSNVKLQLERVNRELVEIQRAAQIGQWKYNTNDNLFYYWGHTGIFCDNEVRSIMLDEYTKLILAEDRASFVKWLSSKKDSDDKEDCLDYRIKYDERIYYIRLKAYVHELMPDGSFTIEGYIQNVTDIQRRRNDINTLTHAI
ncbi:MAG: hybrid sensor histidine kinase/response regulator, partial [Bacteroides sp.]